MILGGRDMAQSGDRIKHNGSAYHVMTAEPDEKVVNEVAPAVDSETSFFQTIKELAVEQIATSQHCYKSGRAQLIDNLRCSIELRIEDVITHQTGSGCRYGPEKAIRHVLGALVVRRPGDYEVIIVI